jgi:K+/H+ antiporter YhaU regulatory subunit KhtT
LALTVKTVSLPIVGIERNGKRLLNPESNIVLENDILWIGKQN